MTAMIVQLSLGDTPTTSIEFKVLFAVAMTLFVLTLAMNIVAQWVSQRFREEYDVSAAAPSAQLSAFAPRVRIRRSVSVAFMVAALLAIAISMIMLGALIVEIAVDGAARLFTDGGRRGPGSARRGDRQRSAHARGHGLDDLGRARRDPLPLRRSAPGQCPGSRSAPTR